ncbi:Interleukin-21 receptor [Channa argus]|uniref:Interleukin-21 receptor n=1 Tax=Channa argus TaxID=215402 RepID=A0A6G1PPL6_CHAAH|nr:Interleukin-21 receptor [Channa argus]KAK2909854.1 hypothetical protein Q8A73_007569 [Channa argus]
MAAKPVCLLLLWGLTVFIHDVKSSCNVTCSTDYKVLLNCSCSGSLPTFPVPVEVNCRSYEETEVNGSCEIKPPQSWCAMHLDMLEDVASIGTVCTARVRHYGASEVSESSTWDLSDVVKPWPPFDVQVKYTDGFYNISWSNNNSVDDCLTYRVCISENNGLSQHQVYSLLADKQFILVDHKKLQQHFNYTVFVQAKMCPENLYQGPWSEWSPTTNWRTTGGISGYWCYVFLAIILVLGLLLLGFTQKPYWQKRLQLFTFVPKPSEFFKPLYHNYGGNFKEWVNPVFDEYDYLKINSHLPMTSEKQPDILQWNHEKPSYSEDSEIKQGGHFLHMVQPHCSFFRPLQDDGSSQGTGHSMGHVSIHTVMLSGEEFEEEAMSQSSMNTLRSYQDEESFHSFGEDNREHSGYNLGVINLSGNSRQSGILPQHENQAYNGLSLEVNFQQLGLFNEPERVSLVSFDSNEHSEDGYPHVDLDTIDSGFAECSSPGASDTSKAEHIVSDLFNEHKNSNSNYVKQWMICSTIQEDSGNSENELQET